MYQSTSIDSKIGSIHHIENEIIVSDREEEDLSKLSVFSYPVAEREAEYTRRMKSITALLHLMTKLYWFVVGERLILHQNRTLLKTRSWIISSDWQNNVKSRQLFGSCIHLFCLWCCWYFVFHRVCPVFPVCGLKKTQHDKWCSGPTIIFINPNLLIDVNTLVYILVRVWVECLDFGFCDKILNLLYALHFKRDSNIVNKNKITEIDWIYSNSS